MAPERARRGSADRIATIEHHADDAERNLTATALAHAKDFRQPHQFGAVGSKIEAAVVRTSFAPPVPPILAVAQVAGMGVVGGIIALDSDAVKRLGAPGTPVILVRRETVTTDIEGMALSAGILTGSGGRTSHAAVVARQLGEVCLVACPGLHTDLVRRQCRIGETLLDEGDPLSLDGNVGAIHAGRLDVETERPEQALATIASWSVAVAA